ncbi:MAG: class I SAM-dependent methyltransferase [Candidatus Desulfofervidaceae bacterium]|nr:class I SAM-dependent methyltransferase [Candidatus Desulfofervidaceae bacterium]MDL1971297.1 class I SAM-dependent methyltransferase [Candidatus Desulfofervidaceae bacterium]
MAGKDKIEQFAEVAKTIFAPVYPVVARQILNTLDIHKGLCLDIGTGPALLVYETARQSSLKLVGIDNKEKALCIARGILKEKDPHGKIISRISLGVADVLNLPFKNDTFDLVISRGSLFFWQDKVRGIKEVYRVLKTGGKAMLGGGFGNKRLKEQIATEIKAVYPDWEERVEKRRQKFTPDTLRALALKANIGAYRIIYDEVNMWIVFEKDENF